MRDQSRRDRAADKAIRAGEEDSHLALPRFRRLLSSPATVREDKCSRSRDAFRALHPPPLPRGRTSVSVLAARFARELCRRGFAKIVPRPVARMERSAIRERSSSFNADPGFHFVPSGLRKNERNKEAERRQTRGSPSRTQASRGARHG